MSRFFSYILLIFLLFFYEVASAQIAVSAFVDKNKIFIGEQITLTLEANFNAPSTESFFKIDSIHHFEILERSKIDTQINNGKLKFQQSFTLTSFDSGKWQIPPFVVLGQKTKAITIEVGFSPFDPNQEYHDIKDIIEVQKSERTTWYWYAIIAALILLLFALFFPKGKKEKVVQVENKDAYKIAISELEELKKKRATEGDAKEFYTSLIFIFRKYLFQRKGILSHTKTTDDLAVQIKKLNLREKEFTHLLQNLRLSDAVKFARFQPTVADNEEALITIKESIQIIEETER